MVGYWPSSSELEGYQQPLDFCTYHEFQSGKMAADEEEMTKADHGALAIDRKNCTIEKLPAQWNTWTLTEKAWSVRKNLKIY